MIPSPFLLEKNILKQEPSCEILMGLKEVVEIVMSHVFTEEKLHYLEIKLSDHRKLLTDTSWLLFTTETPLCRTLSSYVALAIFQKCV